MIATRPEIRGVLTGIAGGWTLARQKTNSMRYIPALDGIRAVAIIAVLIFHICPAALQGGFTGVDVFFVLSGFLITSIILPDIQAREFSLREFYVRRIQRLLPNLVVTVFVTVLLWHFLLPPSAATQVARHALWTLFSLSNVFIWKNLGGYWGDAAEWSPLTHTWSLAVEEQFYLIFPSLLLVLARFRRVPIRHWLLMGTLASFVLCTLGTRSHPVPTFYLLPTRVWELLLGAFLAALQQYRARPETSWKWVSERTGGWAGWTGLAMIVGGFFLIPQDEGFPGLVSLVPTLGTALLLIAAVDDRTRMARVLSNPFMVETGKLSYSLYLWHWPLIILGKYEADLHGYPQLAGTTAGGIAGILAGVVAYRLVESPLRVRGPGRAGRLGIIAAGFAAVTLVGGTLARSGPRSADPSHRFDPPAFSGVLYHVGAPSDPNAPLATRFYDVQLPKVPQRPRDSWRTGGLIHRYGSNQPQVVVLGSSHAVMYSPLVDDLCRELHLSVAFLGVNGGTPAFFEATPNASFSSAAEAAEFDATRRRLIREWKPEMILIIDKWDSWVAPPHDFGAKLRAFLSEVGPFTGRVLFVSQVPVTPVGEQINLREFVNWRMGASDSLPVMKPDSKEPLRVKSAEIAEAVQSEFPGLRVLRPDRAFYQPDGSIRYASGRTFYYADDDHLTDAGVETVRELFRAAITEAHAAASGGSR